MSPNEMTGLQIMQAFAQGLYPKPGIARTIPMELEVMEAALSPAALQAALATTANDRQRERPTGD